MKFYTDDGNWDCVGNNTPIFFIRDPILVSCLLLLYQLKLLLWYELSPWCVYELLENINFFSFSPLRSYLTVSSGLLMLSALMSILLTRFIHFFFVVSKLHSHTETKPCDTFEGIQNTTYLLSCILTAPYFISLLCLMSDDFTWGERPQCLLLLCVFY
jgi:hypothetical protein